MVLFREEALGSGQTPALHAISHRQSKGPTVEFKSVVPIGKGECPALLRRIQAEISLRWKLARMQ